MLIFLFYTPFFLHNGILCEYNNKLCAWAASNLMSLIYFSTYVLAYSKKLWWIRAVKFGKKTLANGNPFAIPFNVPHFKGNW